MTKLEIKSAYERKDRNGRDDDLDPEIKALLDELTKKTADAVKASDDRVKALEDEFNKLIANANRPRFGGDNPASKKAAEIEAKNLNAYIRGEFKAMTVDIDPSAGYFVPDVLQSSMTEKLYDPPTMLSLVRTEQWDGPGSEWIEPLKRALLTARRRTNERETAQDTSQPNPVGLLTVPAGEAEALLEFSQKLLDDASRDLSSMAFADMDAAFDRQLDAEIITGTGTSSQAQGFLNVPIVATTDATRPWGSLQYVASGNGTGLSSTAAGDNIKDLVWSLRAPYRAGASFVMSSNTANAVDKIKNSIGDYIWRDSMSAGTPPTLLGYPVYFDENMPAIAAGSLPIAFGNWKLGYLAAKKKGTRFLRDPYTAKPNIVLYGYKRQGGGVANSEAIKVLKIAAS